MYRLLSSRAGVLTSGFYVMVFMTMGVQVPFWPLWLSDWGLGAEEIGFYSALGMAVRVVAGLAVPALADRLDRRRLTVAACAAASLVLYLAHLGIHHRAMLLVATLGVGASMAGIGPIGEALGIAASRTWHFAYAQARGLGSLGYLVANLSGGALIAATGSWIALWWIVVCLAGVIGFALCHPGDHGAAEGQTPPGMREIGRLVMSPTFAVFMGVVACIQASHAVMFALGSLHWRQLGISETEIGALWAVAVTAEIAFMLLIGTATIQRLGPIRALTISAVGCAVRWAAMMTDPTGAALWAIQCLHALTFAMGHLGAMAFISRAVPVRYAAAAQGATGAMAVGGLMALGMALAGLLYPELGGRTYVIGVAFATIGLGLCALLARDWKGQVVAV